MSISNDSHESNDIIRAYGRNPSSYQHPDDVRAYLASSETRLKLVKERELRVLTPQEEADWGAACAAEDYAQDALEASGDWSFVP